MKLSLPKVNWEKVGAYTAGALLGGGLSAAAWHLMEKHGMNPGGFFRKKVIQGNITYYDPAKDPNMADMMSEIEEEDADEGDGINEAYEEDVDDDFLGVDGGPEEDEDSGGEDREEREDPDGGTDGIYQIDRETWYHSEDDEDYKHAEMKYWIEDRQVSDEYDKKIRNPWKLIGLDNYDILSNDNCEREIFVRNEELETDYVITRTDGSFD